jgi:hypothetical protein
LNFINTGNEGVAMILPNHIKRMVLGCASLVTVSLVGMDQPKHPAFDTKIYKAHARALLDNMSTLAKQFGKSDENLNELLQHFLADHMINNKCVNKNSHVFIDNITLKDIQNINLSKPRDDVKLLFWWYVQKMVLFGVLKNVGCSYQDLNVPGIKLEKVSQEVFRKRVKSFYQQKSNDYATREEAQALATAIVSLLRKRETRAEITDFSINESDTKL